MSQFRPIRPGERVTKWPRQPWNQMLRQLGGEFGGGMPGAPFSDAVNVRVENGTEDVVDRFGILRVGAPVTKPSEGENRFFDEDELVGTAPESGQPFVVLQEPVGPGGFGIARIAGITRARVNLTDTSHQFADAIDGDTTKLASASSGPARILWVESDSEGSGSGSGGSGSSGSSGTGVQWAVVLLGSGAGCDCIDVVLTGKDYDTYSPQILYTATRVTPVRGGTGSGSGTGTFDFELGDPVEDLIFHLQNIDLVVWADEGGSGSGSSGGSSGVAEVPEECVVRICRGANGDWFITNEPRWEFVAINGNPDADGVFPAVMVTWHQEDDEVVALDTNCEIIDINAFVGP